MDVEKLLSWCEVQETVLRDNARAFKARLSSETKLGVVVKSDGYGHGLAIAARALLSGGADWLIVNTVDEAIALRKASIAAPVYICGHVHVPLLDRVLESRARLVVYDKAIVDALAQLAQSHRVTVPVHLKLETGTHRQGLTLDDALVLAKHIKSLRGLELEGLTTHFADIEDSTNHTYAESQSARFHAALTAFAEAGLPIPLPHSANSAATLLYSETHHALVRVGIAAYGLWPSKETYASALQRSADGHGPAIKLQPALAWRARIVQLKDVPAGAYVGYGRTYRTTAASRIAVLPVGYFEGYDRRLTNVAHVLVGGQRAQVRGRVCMNMCMVDVTHVPGVRVGDVATLLGRDGDEELSAEQLAGWMGTINYEVVARIHPSQPRLVV